MMMPEVPRASSFSREDVLPVNQDGYTKKVTIEELADDILKRIRTNENN